MDVTRLLNAAQAGDEAAGHEVLSHLRDELRRMAARTRSPGSQLSPTTLVHEAYLRMAGREAPWESRGHFLGYAARAMRSVLVDRARERAALKRGGAFERKPLDDALAWFEGKGPDLLALDHALERLAQHDPRLHRLVELRFFAGLSVEDAAEALGVSRATAQRDWVVARARLRAWMSP